MRIGHILTDFAREDSYLRISQTSDDDALQKVRVLRGGVLIPWGLNWGPSIYSTLCGAPPLQDIQYQTPQPPMLFTGW